jgi:heme-degrading monooxygenase HmoA
MISRQWRGTARRSEAERYVAHLREETFPQLERLEGFRGSSILRRDVAAGVEFRIVTLWDSLDAIRAFAGADLETAVVPDKVKAMMVSYDRAAAHYEVVG